MTTGPLGFFMTATGWHLATLAFILMPGAASGQDVTGLPGPPIFQFSFSNPGARSMGFGGAFVSLADDATAAFANPAGLVQISRAEISLEGRSWSYTTRYSERGRFEGESTGIGIDMVDGLATGTSDYDTTGISFLSFVYPRNNWSIALYRHQLADFSYLSQTQGFFSGTDATCCRFVDFRTSSDLEIVSYGLAGGYRVNDALSLGLSAVYFDALYDVVGEGYLPDESADLPLFAPTSFFPERMVGRTTATIDDSDWGLTAGLLWNVSPQWRLGGFYRQGPRILLNGEARTGEAGEYFGLPPAGTLLGRTAPSLVFPDVYGLGTTFRPTDGRLTVSFEWARVGYSSILTSLGSEFDTSTLALSDGDELHLGGEYVFVQTSPLVAARIGLWLDPEHQAYFTEEALDIEQALLPPGEDEIHYALGLGLAMKNFQLDLAADFSKPVDTVALSAIYSF